MGLRLLNCILNGMSILKNFAHLINWCILGKLHHHSAAFRRQFSNSVVMANKPKTAILMLNMGGPQHIDQVHDYLLNIMTGKI